ncbi:uncharacterized protein LOC114263665 [Camellia sinensis]|uniref:uncharacterized protein LOC114263665 n=1 Tax=Camellia sinensis TaxID=4442 RepID=UPI0010365CB9|nr:uncharacterized protein LOC114263665 [Camellia sinensis]
MDSLNAPAISLAKVAAPYPLVDRCLAPNNRIRSFQPESVVDGSSQERIHFWWDTWLLNEKLKDVFPRLFSLSEITDGSLKPLVQNREAAGEWNFSFKRPLKAWEEKDIRRLIEVLNAIPNLWVNVDDQVRWIADSSGSFSVSSARRRCEVNHGPSIGITKLLWGNDTPPKVKFFHWLAWKGRVKTTAYLQRIGVLNSSVNNLCPFCKEEVESLNHIILYYPLVWSLWCEILEWWNLSWVIPGSIGGLLEWWSGVSFNRFERRLWQSILFTFVWSV